MKRQTILLLIIAILLSRYAFALPAEVRIVGEVEITAPAVTNISGIARGVLTKIKITVTEGAGDVYVATASLTEVDMQATARIAAQIACELLGYDYSDYDFLIKVESRSIIVGGPSAGAIMTIGIISALTGWDIRKDVLMTGTINPDGSVGPVGGILEKIEAAAQQDVKLFLIPLGQSIVVKYEIIQKQVGPFVFTQVKPVRVDLAEYAREKWNIKVLEVADIAEAASIFFNKSFTYTAIEKPKFQQLTKEILLESAEKLITNAKIMRKTLTCRIEESSISKKAKNQLYSILDEEVNANIKEANQLLENKPYISASLAFQALVSLQFIDNVLSYESYGLEKITSETLEALKEVSDRIDDATIDSRMDIELLMAAKYRLEEAKEKYKEANKTVNIYEKLYLLAYSMQRAYTSSLWLDAMEKFSSKETLSFTQIRRTANDYLLTARNAWSYAYTLVSQSNILIEELSKAEKAYEKAEKAFEEEDYVLSCAFAIEAIVESELALNKLHLKAVQMDITNTLVEKAREKALNILSTAQNFTTPILASGYMELGDYTKDYETKLKLYKLSSYYSKLALQLAKAKILKETKNMIHDRCEKAAVEIASKIYDRTIGIVALLVIIFIIVICLVYYRRFKKTTSQQHSFQAANDSPSEILGENK